MQIEVLETGEILEGMIGDMTAEEKEILLSGCLINYNRKLLN